MTEQPDELDAEIEDLVSKAQSQDDESDEADDSDSDDSDESADEQSKKRVRKTRKRRSRKAKGAAKTLDQLDVDSLLPADLPKPGQNIKGLGDLYAKYGVGERPEFRIHLYRSWPKIGPGGTKFDGFYDEYDMPLTEQQIQADYGGGQFRIAVVGPHPQNPRVPKTYESHSVSIAGEPNFDRVPRALQGKKSRDDAASSNPSPLPMIPSSENPKLAEAALKMFEKQADAERAERRRLEEKIDERQVTAGVGSQALAEAERRRADDLIRAAQERADAERRSMEQRMEEIKRENEESRRRVESEVRSRPSFGEELSALAQAGLFANKDDSTVRSMLEQILAKHRDEVSAIHAAQQEFIRSMREGHQAEIAALRAASTRELQAEREASRSREERIEERLRSEREERDRDRQRHKESMDERDRMWKDRMEGALHTKESAWESRHQMLVSTQETRLTTLQAELDRLKTENYELRSKVEEKGDVFAQLTRYRELKTIMKDFSDGDASSSSSSAGGIGLTGGQTDQWKETLAEGLTERAPLILEKLFGGGGGGAGGGSGSQPQPQPQPVPQHFTEGQIVDTPHGKMEVVRNPADGQLALAPKEALDEHRAAVAAAAQSGGGLLPSAGGAPTRRTKPPRRRSRSAGVSAVPNLAEGLPRRKAPWEGGGPDIDREAPPPVPPMPRMATRTPEPSKTPPLELSAIERQGLQIIAKEVHESVQNADDPDEFVQKMIQKYPAQALQQLVGTYSDRQIAQGIIQLQPNSAGATPAGRAFVIRAFALLRHAAAEEA